MSAIATAITTSIRHTLDLVLSLEHLLVPVLWLVVVTVAASAGYCLLLGVGPLDGLYQAILTLSTVGFLEVAPFDWRAKLFTIILVFLGVGTVFYVVTLLAATVVEGEIRRNFRRRLMLRTIGSMKRHIIVCGFGRVGAEISRMLSDRKRDFVVVDRDPEAIAQARTHQWNVVSGNAEDEEILREAGVERASGLVAATTSDAINTYITLTAGSLNKDLAIVSRAETAVAAQKLKLAGANHVVSPYSIGARRMALSALQPMMADFMDALVEGRHGDMLIAELEVTEDSSLDGCTLAEAFTKSPTTNVLAIRRTDGSLVVGPRGSDILNCGDMVIVMAEEANIPGLAV